MERGEASKVVTECLKYLMDHIQPERSKREDCEKGFHFQTDPTKQYENGWDCDCGAQIRRCGTLNTMET